jgi:hypothetical protein
MVNAGDSCQFPSCRRAGPRRRPINSEHGARWPIRRPRRQSVHELHEVGGPGERTLNGQVRFARKAIRIPPFYKRPNPAWNWQ